MKIIINGHEIEGNADIVGSKLLIMTEGYSLSQLEEIIGGNPVIVDGFWSYDEFEKLEKDSDGQTTIVLKQNFNDVVALNTVAGKRVTLCYAKYIRDEIEQLTSQLTDAVAKNYPTLYPEWQVGKEYVLNERICYDAVLYKCKKKHISEEEQTPDIFEEGWKKL